MKRKISADFLLVDICNLGGFDTRRASAANISSPGLAGAYLTRMSVSGAFFSSLRDVLVEPASFAFKLSEPGYHAAPDDFQNLLCELSPFADVAAEGQFALGRLTTW